MTKEELENAIAVVDMQLSLWEKEMVRCDEKIERLLKAKVLLLKQYGETNGT